MTVEIRLQKAGQDDCEMIHAMQVASFRPLLDRYRDYDTNPGAEPLEKVKARMGQAYTDYYLIRLGPISIGAVRVIRLPGCTCRISPLFILPEYQGKGLAQQALAAVERLYPRADCWALETIKQEDKLLHLYEKMGYRPTGREEELGPGMTIVDYEKNLGRTNGTRCQETTPLQGLTRQEAR